MAYKSVFEDMPVAERVALAQRLQKAIEAFPTRSEAARALDVSTDTLANIVAARSSATALLLARLALATGYAVDWLLLGMGPEKRDPLKIERALVNMPEERVQQVFSSLEQSRHQILLLQKLEEPLQELYAGLPELDKDHIVGEAIDRVQDTGCRPELWPHLADILLAAHATVRSEGPVPATVRGTLAAKASLDAVHYLSLGSPKAPKPAKKKGKKKS